METVKKVYIGVALDKAKESIKMASFSEDGEADARQSAENQCPGLPVFTFRLFDKPSNIKKALFNFLTEQEIPKYEYLEIFGLEIPMKIPLNSL